MWKQRLTLRVREHVDRVLAGQRVEDDLVECKAEWPDPKWTARQLAGHANAARGEPLLWIIGLDEEAHEVTGSGDTEPSEWHPQIASVFDGPAPAPRHLVIPLDAGLSVVAIEFETDQAPYVVKRIAQEGRFEREVPWRDATRTRSAWRHELLGVLVPRVAVPEIEPVSLRLVGVLQEELHLGLQGEVFIHGQVGDMAIFPAHRMRGTVRFASPRLPEDDEPTVTDAALETLRLSMPSRTERGPESRVWSGIVPSEPTEGHPFGVDVHEGNCYVAGAGTVYIRGGTTLRLSALDPESLQQSVEVELTFRLTGADDRAVRVSCVLDPEATKSPMEPVWSLGRPSGDEPA